MIEELSIEMNTLIEIVPGKGLGKAYIKESRIAVSDVMGMLKDGMSNKEILNYFPALQEEHISACIVHDANSGLIRE